MAKLLTVRKQAWVDKRKQEIVYGNPLNPSAGAEVRYMQKLSMLIDRMCKMAHDDIVAGFSTEHAEKFFSTDASVAYQAKLIQQRLMKKIMEMFDMHAQPIAESVANAADKSSSASLHASLQQLSGGLSFGTSSLSGSVMEVWKATVNENVALIKSIASQYLSQVSSAVQRSITTGRGLHDLVPFLEKQKGITHRRAQFIAMDQTRKSFNALSRIRMQKVGMTKGEWLHTGGSNHPRKSHIEMSGKIFDLEKGLWDPAVERFVFPAEEPGCRCRMIPVLLNENVQ